MTIFYINPLLKLTVPSFELRLYVDTPWYPASEIGDIIATRNMIANPQKQQIAPLRCAPVGMTYLCR
jgi:hypothetical protein